MKKNTQITKEQLQKQINAITAQEEKEMIEKHYPKFKKLEGTFYKQKDNYSCHNKASDYWFSYTKVTKIKPTDIYDTKGNGITSRFEGYAFRTDKYGTFSVNKEKIGYVHSLGIQISEQEFNQAWNKAMQNLNKLP